MSMETMREVNLRWLPTGAITAIAMILPALAGCMTDPASRPGGGAGAGSTPAQSTIAAALGDDSCRWARDGECDDIRFSGTGACNIGTDATDCRVLASGGNNSCQWAYDNECDEPGIGLGVCAEGTDAADCAGVAHLRNRNNRCRTSFDGRCDEPDIGTGRCAPRTDSVDCIGRATAPGVRDHHFGYDDRQRVDTARYPWSAIGEVSFRDGSSCTASLVAEDVAITAAHCFFTDGNPVQPTVFRAGRDGNRHAASANVIRHFLAADFNYLIWSQTNQLENSDWAFMVLDQPIGRTAGTLGVYEMGPADMERATGNSWHTVYQAGYSWDAPTRMTGNIDCNVVQVRNNGTIFHECDTTRGDSGSPIFIEIDGDFFIIAIDSQFYVTSGGPSRYLAVDSRSFGSALNNFLLGL